MDPVLVSFAWGLLAGLLCGVGITLQFVHQRYPKNIMDFYAAAVRLDLMTGPLCECGLRRYFHEHQDLGHQFQPQETTCGGGA